MENENVKCDSSHFTGISCEKSANYHDNTLTIPISQCNKNTQIHLSGLQSLERSEPNSISNKGKGLDFYNYPEALIILYRTGYFNIDARLLNLNRWQQHRDYFGIYWRRSKLKCCYPEHPASSKAKVDRGASPRVCKEYWLKAREVINIGAGKNTTPLHTYTHRLDLWGKTDWNVFYKTKNRSTNVCVFTITCWKNRVVR